MEKKGGIGLIILAVLLVVFILGLFIYSPSPARDYIDAVGNNDTDKEVDIKIEQLYGDLNYTLSNESVDNNMSHISPKDLYNSLSGYALVDSDTQAGIFLDRRKGIEYITTIIVDQKGRVYAKTELKPIK